MKIYKSFAEVLCFVKNNMEDFDKENVWFRILRMDGGHLSHPVTPFCLVCTMHSIDDLNSRVIGVDIETIHNRVYVTFKLF